MIEREIECPELFSGEPARVGGVVSSADGPADRSHVVEDAHRVSARVASRIRIDAEDLSDRAALQQGVRYLEAGLFQDFPGAGFLGRLAPLRESARQRPLSPERRASAADEEDPPATVADPGVDGQPRRLRKASPLQGRSPSGSTPGSTPGPKNSRISCAGRRDASSRGVSSYQSRGIRLT